MFRDPVLLGWGWNQSILRDHEGDWWIPTERGIFRFAKPRHLADLARARPKANYTMRDGLSANGIFRLFEDSRGDVWVSVMAEGIQLFRWDRRQSKFFPQSVKGDAPDQKTEAPTAFAEDKDGAVWVGFYIGGLARYRNGQWDFFDSSAGAPSGFVDDLHFDRAGRMWIAYNGGLKRIDDTRAAVPQFVTYTKDHGLPSNAITSLAEDHYGRIYLGMNSRITRLDPRFPPKSARLKHYTAADGVLNGNARAMLRDRDGAIWTAGVNGVARLIPEPPESEPPAPVRIVGLKAGGTSQRLSEFGETHAKGFSFPDKGGSVEIEFASLSYIPGLDHSYSYMLEGSGAGWSRPSPGNRVVLAALAPGSYKFMVKAVSHDSDAESEPAILDFTIAAPMYRRAWFLALLALSAAFGIIVFYRNRWKRAVELERIRMQIATDLHDELGAGLSQVAMISEVALLATKETEKSRALTRVAKLSRELLDSAGDLVWAIRPRRDRVNDLAQRMREFATETLSLLNIRFEFNIASSAVNLTLDPEQRRQVFAVFKESINNVVRHSGCSRVRVDLSRDDGTLVLATTDDGKGIVANGDPELAGHHGIPGMKWRAQMLGGAIEMDSPSGNGLRVTLRVPLEHKRRRRTPA
jgi:signal transduction histidine kinase